MSSLRNAYHRVGGSRWLPFIQTCTTNGLINGPKAANVNGSVTPVEFYIQVPANMIYVINRVSINVSDASNAPYNGYGNIVGPLANGVQFWARINGVKADFANPPTKSNIDMYDFGPDTQVLNFTSNIRVTRFAFDVLQYSQGVVYDGDKGDQYGARIRDDLSTLDAHTITVNGYSIVKSLA